MRPALPAWLLLTAALTAAPTPYVDKKAPVADEAWMNARMRPGELLQSGQQLDPEGSIIDVSGRLLALEFARGGQVLVLKTTTTLATFEPGSFKLLAKEDFPIAKGGGSMHGLAISADGATAVVSGGRTHLYVAKFAATGKFTWGTSIDVSGGAKNVNPLGIALTKDGRFAYVALSMANSLAKVDLASGKVVAQVSVGICPYGVALSPDERTAYVSNFGGDRPETTDITESSGGSLVAVDARPVALRGTISIVDVASAPKVSGQLTVGLHPSELLLADEGRTLFVANVGADSVSVIDTATRKVVRSLGTKPEADLPWGTLTDGLALSPDGKTLYTALAGLNAVGCLDLANPAASPKLIPTGWYPGAVRVQGGALFIANVRSGVQKAMLPTTSEQIAQLDARARRAAHLSYATRSATRTAQPGVKPVAVPAEPGQPSVIKHVVYIIKENRTYDQVLGDLGKGNGEPKLCIFPRKITPNHHAIADRFPLLDNYYCNGVNSSDGHAWGIQGIVGPYREKDRVGYRCGYDFGTDALFYAGCGFLWDHALLGGKSFRNYGEMDYTAKLKGKTYADFYNSWKNRDGKAVFATSYQIETLRRYSSKDFPGWEMSIPDQVRADVFLKELADFERKGTFPDLTIIYLPNDHTSSELTPNSYLADNDLALGRVVEGLSRSRFWGEMAIFVNEDDPQTGGDHVDGHRSFCFVISPWAKRGAVISKFYNQTSVLHTMCRILGLQPLNQVVAASPTMEDCFAETADLEPFTHLVPASPLNEARPKPKPKTAGWLPTRTSDELVLARMERMDFSRPDLIHEDTLNRAIWLQTRPGERYPAEWAGPHGRGLAALGLVLDPELDDDDD
jgi:YVTN family beta-propeller protein